jgi:formylglycine-generating enzyme required for sulfatase activity
MKKAALGKAALMALMVALVALDGCKDPAGGDPGVEDPGKEESGKEESGKEESGKEDPGKEDPGKEEPKAPAGFVVVEGGTFTMGNPGDEENRDEVEGPQRQVTVKSFYLGKYEVTQKEWKDVMGDNPSYFKGDTLPVETVSWLEAVEYCNKRSKAESLSPAYTINGTTVNCNWSATGCRLRRNGSTRRREGTRRRAICTRGATRQGKWGGI